MRLNKFKDDVWNKSLNCDCENHFDNHQSHKICSWCGDIMVYSQFANQNGKKTNSTEAWTIGFLLPINRGGLKKVENLQAIHAKCETEKSDDYTIIFGSDNWA